MSYSASFSVLIEEILHFDQNSHFGLFEFSEVGYIPDMADYMPLIDFSTINIIAAELIA